MALDPRDTRGQLRLFVGVRVSVACANQLGSAAEALARRAQQTGVRARWVAPASYHVTLAFLGWARRDAIEAVADAIARATINEAPFGFRAARLGAFPDLEKATVVWAGVEDSGALARIAGALGRELAALGFPADPRPFHPHVTLGRLAQPAAVSGVVLPLAEQVFSDTRVNAVTLYESEMKPGGSEYRSVTEIPLFGPENAAKRQTSPVQPASLDAATGASRAIETDDGWDRDPERRP
ncbi:MAG: RNA 2',3'-cyclic phosphodiesterase [Deltaproteobacteria bacterium]|nr:RNA 2',3'-cyclic phosphodiesterase [Deltaproteobacteria bacterium]